MIFGGETMFADPYKEYARFNYLFGDMPSISTKRYFHLLKLARLAKKSNKPLKIAYRDPFSKAWSEWKPFFGGTKITSLQRAYDIHRSILENEIVVESDYPEYERNVEAAKIIGAILQKKGFVPHFYYSGSKSIHIHVFLDFKRLVDSDMLLQEQILSLFKYKGHFINKFMEWLRTKIINCWDTKAKQFDENLIRASHLIRSELSFNKFGYKTFLGYNYKDLSYIPYICNENNSIKPKLGDIKISRLNNPSELLEEFITYLHRGKKRSKIDKPESSLNKWIPGSKKSPRNTHIACHSSIAWPP